MRWPRWPSISRSRIRAPPSAATSSAASSRASSALQSRTGRDPLTPLGSYAGAMGMPQFMPSSIAKWAVDFDGDGRIDLVDSPADVIGSVANYFKGFGWQPGMPTHYPGELRRRAAGQGRRCSRRTSCRPSASTAFIAKGAVLQGAALRAPGPAGADRTAERRRRAAATSRARRTST